MTSFPSDVQALIFDLGGVIIDLAVHKTVEAFSALSGLPHQTIKEAYLKHSQFFEYERGELSDTEFRNALRRIFSMTDVTDHQLDECWNAMLVGLPMEKLNLIDRLKQKYSVYVLSNTNNIHMECVHSRLLNGKQLDTYFHKCYYSHQLGMRKPEPEIFEHVLKDSVRTAAQAIFFDDNPQNVEAANKVGITAILIQHPDRIFDFTNRL
jgi:putative hydrolase of the HAD superfamily